MKTKITLFLLLVSCIAIAQQEERYSQYMYNSIVFNPAYAGNRGNFNSFLLHRSQWAGFDGAPTTSNFSIDTRINENMGIGLTFVNDRIGPSNENNLSVDFSYGFSVSDEWRLSFGIKAGVSLLNINFSQLTGNDGGDYVFGTNVENQFSPNIGVGVYLNSDVAYFGISSPKLLSTTQFDRNSGNAGSSSGVMKKEIHLYVMGGYVFDLDRNIKFKPSILTKLVQGSPMQIDLSANFLFNDNFAAGVSYGLNTAVNAMAGFQVSDQWFIGYSYGRETTRLATYRPASHEIFLRFSLFDNYDPRVIAPRFF